MKRDMELIRAIMLRIEDGPEPTLARVEIDNTPQATVEHHVTLLNEAGLVTGSPVHTLLGDEWLEVRLTWDGHEFLDAARNESAWRKVWGALGQSGLHTVPFNVLSALLVSYIKHEVGLP